MASAFHSIPREVVNGFERLTILLLSLIFGLNPIEIFENIQHLA